MSEVKFTCPTCGQPVLVSASEAGRKLACPSCQRQITVPDAAPPSSDRPAATTAEEAQAAKSGASDAATTPPLPVPPAEGASSLRLEPTKTSASVATTHAAAEMRRTLGDGSEEAAEAPEAGPATVAAAPGLPPEAAAAPPEEAPAPAQIAVLTSALKRSIVEEARQIIADPDHWLPGVDEEGRLLYAAKQVKGRWKPLEPANEEATHRSLMGAVLRELHRRNVAPTAGGRTEFLDADIPEAIRKVAPEAAEAAEAVEGGDKPKAKAARLMSLSHPQCLEVLDLLQGEYAVKAAAEAEAPARGASRGASVEELLVRASRDEAMTVTEVLRALHAELVTLNHRIADLERAAGRTEPAAPAAGSS